MSMASQIHQRDKRMTMFTDHLKNPGVVNQNRYKLVPPTSWW